MQRDRASSERGRSIVRRTFGVGVYIALVCVALLSAIHPFAAEEKKGIALREKGIQFEDTNSVAPTNTAFRGVGFAPASPADFSFTTIDVPGATNTGAVGINNLGQIVGIYILPNATLHGFLDIGGTFTTIDDPNATFGTGANDINSSGQIAGSYNFTDPNHPFEGAHGFLLSGSTFTPIDFPMQGVTSTTPQGINDSGDVVGLYRMNSPGNGFLYSGGVYTAVNVPSSLGCCTHANGINNAGQIVGQYKFPDDNGTKHGFLKIGDTFTTIDFPGAVATTAQGINNFGDIVGGAQIGNANFGFLLRGGDFFTIAFPGALQTQVGEISDQGNVVGVYTDSNMVLHGFQAAMVPPSPQSAFSRKTQGGAGTFDISLPLFGNVGIECRSGGGTNDYQMIINFASTVTVGATAVTSGTGSVSSFSVSGSQVTVNLTGVTTAQRITVTLHNVSDGTNTGDVSVSMGVLVGDVNGNAVVNATDVAQTKGQVGQAVMSSNFREDVNASGTITATDVAIVKSKVGTALPP
jgi:hypothetical protein